MIKAGDTDFQHPQPRAELWRIVRGEVLDNAYQPAVFLEQIVRSLRGQVAGEVDQHADAYQKRGNGYLELRWVQPLQATS